MADRKDTAILRELAKKVAEISEQSIQEKRRDLWRKHNSLVRTRPLIYVRAFAWHEIFPDSLLECEDGFYRPYERYLREMIYRDTLGDDYIVEPWVTVKAVYRYPAQGLNYRWGPEIKTIPSTEQRGSWKFDPPLKAPSDINKLVRPRHVIDEEATVEKVGKLQDAIGDILEVNVDRGPLYFMWMGDISTDFAYLRGLEQIMWDLFDHPEWLHQLAAFMRDSILTVHELAEEAGDWRLCNHQNQAMPYAQELADPVANSQSVGRRQLWYFMASQEFAQVSPQMFDEFLLQYQIPILEKFGLVAYGCCEDLTKKIDYLRRIPNLRRIAVAPWADIRQCAEQIQEDYVLSWRPSPAEMVSTGFCPDRVRQMVREAMQIFREHENHVDITLKDVETVQNNPDVVREWVKVVRDVVDEG